jgi:OOP family OmpA-OmpF porin
MVSSRRVLVILVLVPLAWGCASGRTASLVECAAMGAAAGAGAGAATGHQIEEGDAAAIGGGAAIGIVAGAVLGYGVCALIPEAEEPAPPPPPPAAEKLVLRGVNFAFASDQVDEASKLVLQVAAEQLQKRTDVRVRVEGHTDATGPEDYNQTLSERRANSVRKILVENGVSASRLDAVGFGESRPIASNDTREGRALNRRVELVPIQ